MTKQTIVNSFPSRIIKVVCFFVMLIFFTNSLLAQVIRGKIIDATTDEPVKDALIFLMPKKDRISDMQTSDSLGFFYFNNVLHKSFYIKTDRLGYVDFTFGKLIMPLNDTLSITINLEPVPFTMKEVSVIADKPDLDYNRFLDRIGFYFRKEQGWGKFLTRKDIDKRNPHYTSEMLRGIPGVIISNGNIFSIRTRGLGRPTPMQVYVDGALISSPTMSDGSTVFTPIDIISPISISAVEVYRNFIHAPPQYRRFGSIGGVILIWTGE